MNNHEYCVYWECHLSGVGDVIGYYPLYSQAEKAYYAAIRENPHVHYYLTGRGTHKSYDPNYD